MSEFKVCLTTVIDVKFLENSHSLDIVTVYGFNVVARRGSLNIGDKCFYIPIDSLLPQDLEDLIFPPDAKIKLHHHRVKQIRIRSFPSQGMLISAEDMTDLLKSRKAKAVVFKDETDYAELFGITKYEPPAPTFQSGPNAGKTIKVYNNSNFTKYNGVDNIKWNPNAFKDEEVVIQEKLHGSNCRAGLVPTEANTLWKKIKKFFGKLAPYEHVWGSNNVELTNRKNFKGYYDGDIYGTVLEQVGAFEKLKENEIIYGELIGEGVQKNYTYGIKGHDFVLFDVKVCDQTFADWHWLNPEEVEEYAAERGFKFVPVLYRGVYSKEAIEEHVGGKSVFDPKQAVREGIVVKSRFGYHNSNFASSKKVLKHINPAYLDKDQSDFH